MTGRPTDGRTDGWTDRQTDGRTDRDIAAVKPHLYVMTRCTSSVKLLSLTVLYMLYVLLGGFSYSTPQAHTLAGLGLGWAGPAAHYHL